MASCTPIAAGKTAPLAQWKKLAGEDCQQGFASISWQRGDFVNTTQKLVQIGSEIRTYSVSFQVLEALIYVECTSELLKCKNPQIYFPFSNPIALKGTFQRAPKKKVTKRLAVVWGKPLHPRLAEEAPRSGVMVEVLCVLPDYIGVH